MLALKSRGRFRLPSVGGGYTQGQEEICSLQGAESLHAVSTLKGAPNRK